MTVRWTFTDAEGQTYTADSVDVSAGEPLFKRGQSITLPFAFHDDVNNVSHTETYDRLLSKYEEYLTPNTINTITSHNGIPRFTQNIHPNSGASSYLFKLEPDADLTYQQAWWVVVTEIQDDTTIRGAIERLGITLYPLKPDEGESRTTIENEYEV